MKLGVGVMLVYTHAGKREASIDSAPWKNYWEQETKGGYGCHKIAFLLSLIFSYPAKCSFSFCACFWKGGGQRALWIGLALHLA